MIPGGVVDAHLHLWQLGRFSYPWLADDGSAELRHDYLVSDWRADAEEVEIAATVHVQAEIGHALDPAEETAWLASLGESVPTVCVGYADLRAPDLDEVLDRHQRHALFRGIRQLAWYDPHSAKADVPRENLLDDPRWAAGLRRLAARGLSFDLQVWPHQLAQAAGIFRDLPDLPVVLEHAGLPGQRAEWRDELRRFATQVPHALLKISALRSVSPAWSLDELAPVVHDAIEAFGPDRCLFGSNFPVDRPAVGYGDLWRTYDALTSGYSADERTRMLRTNAASLYRITL
ncbi:amidohydrolase family protein [Nonomuraea bangladeshensis]|uniref:amidohydrolase family protein n=1 Tax=Nonomuraea bangladeshensis TaxID=404385 RepID=UPI0031DBE081